MPLPKNSSITKTLFLDIDETMMHCLDERDPHYYEPDVIIKIPMDDEGDFEEAGIIIRPHLYEFLKLANEQFQVVTFTASD